MADTPLDRYTMDQDLIAAGATNKVSEYGHQIPTLNGREKV